MHLPVAPHVGAWIETEEEEEIQKIQKVAPHVGAWIETEEEEIQKRRRRESHPMWVRGLKLISSERFSSWALSHPMWVRGLKQIILSRGKISVVAPHVGAWIETPERCDVQHVVKVAPHVGAWIETSTEVLYST